MVFGKRSVCPASGRRAVQGAVQASIEIVTGGTLPRCQLPHEIAREAYGLRSDQLAQHALQRLLPAGCGQR